MPFALLLLSRGDTFTIGMIAGALAFLLTGLGMHTTQTAGLALATDLAPEDTRPRVVALMFVMLLVGMMGAAFVMGSLLADFSATRLVAIVQGATSSGIAIISATSHAGVPNSTIITRFNVPLSSTVATPTVTWNSDRRSKRPIGNSALAASANGRNCVPSPAKNRVEAPCRLIRAPPASRGWYRSR